MSLDVARYQNTQLHTFMSCLILLVAAIKYNNDEIFPSTVSTIRNGKGNNDMDKDKNSAAADSSRNSSVENSDSGAEPQPNAEDNTQAAQQPAQEVQVRTIRVPTFAPLRQVRAPVQDINELRRRDPFHYYSDQARRMAHLLHNQGNNNQEDNPPQQPQQAGEHRTRISFEVHPSLFLDDLFDNIMEVEEREESRFDGE